MTKYSEKNNYKANKLKQTLLDIIEDMANDVTSYVVNPSIDFTRKRDLDFETMLHLILSIRGNSLNKEMYSYFSKSPKIPSVSAFVQQRSKIQSNAFIDLFDNFNNNCNDTIMYNGYHLLAVDGSDINIARNPNSETYYKQGFNQFHINAIYDLMNKTYFDAEVQPSPKENEIKAAIEMIERHTFEQKAILIGDRGYEAYNLFEHINRIENLDYLIRVRNNGNKEISKLPLKELDQDIKIELRTTQTKEDKKAFASGKAKWIQGHSKFNKKKKRVSWDFESPFSLSYRVVRFEISPNNYETIITSLNRFEFPLEEIKKLYNLRWGIETSFRELKYAIGLINFHAKKEEFIIQEIYAMLTMYNFCERITLSVVIKQCKNNKYVYQVNFTMAIHICRDFFTCKGNKSPPNVENLINQYILPIRDGRSDKRKIKAKQVISFTFRVA